MSNQLFAQTYLTLQFFDSETGKIVDATVVIKDSVHSPIQTQGVLILDCKQIALRKLYVSHPDYFIKEFKVGNQCGETIAVMMEPTRYDLNTIVVTGTRTERAIKDVPVLTQVISQREIELSGSGNIAHIVNTMRPGVDFYNEGRGMTFRMQGLAAKYTLFLIDGERIAGENRDNIDYTRLFSSGIERVEIVQGAASSLYGSSAIGGVINMVTKTPNRPFESNFFTRYSKFNELETGLNVGVKQNKLAFFTDMYRKSTNGYDLTPQTPDLYTVEPFESYSVFNKILYDVNEKLKLEARASYFVRERFDVAERPTHPFYSDVNGGLKANYQHNEQVKFIISSYGDTYNSYDILEKLGNKKNKNYSHTQISNRLMSEINLGHTNNSVKHMLTAGIEHLHDDMFATRIQDSTRKLNTISLFLQDEILLTEGISVVLGARNDINSEFGYSFSPKASFMYKHNAFRYRATIAKGYRAPGIKERFYDFDLGFIVVKGNDALVPEKSLYTSVSTEYLTAKTNISIALYNNNLKDMIYEKPVEGKQNTYTYLNFNSVNIYGADVFVRTNIISKLNFTAGYSYTYALDMETNKQLIGVSKHSASFALDYFRRLKKNLYGLIINSKIYGEKDFINLTDGQYLLFEDIYPAYSIWKFALVSKMAQNSITLSIGMENALNYVTSSDLISIDPGRRMFFSLGISIDRLYTQLQTIKN